MVVFGIPRLVHPFNPEYQPTFCFKILNPNLQIRGGGSKFTLKALSICQNWPAGLVRCQIKSAFSLGFLLKNHLLSAYYLGSD